jgi:DNA-binding transcriptional LysR family regulator
METKWLEDFVSLAETRSFSRSAQLRHVTQPAFSRRIQALEAWAGTDLVDRSSYPTRLTAAGQTLYMQSLEVLQALQSARATLRDHAVAGQDVIEFAALPTLACAFFADWVAGLRSRFGPLKTRLSALSVHNAMLRLVEGSCDILIAYHHASQPLQLDPDRYDMVLLGHELLAPYASAGADGAPLYRLPTRAGQKLPYLAYAPGADLGAITEGLLQQAGAAVQLDSQHEADMAETLKVLAIQGLGLAFLPTSTVCAELAAGTLVEAAAPELRHNLTLTLEVRAYRAKPQARDLPRRGALALWTFLQSPAPD